MCWVNVRCWQVIVKVGGNIGKKVNIYLRNFSGIIVFNVVPENTLYVVIFVVMGAGCYAFNKSPSFPHFISETIK